MTEGAESSLYMGGVGSYTEMLVSQMVNRIAGVQPLGVAVMSEREVIAELREEDPVVEVSQLIPGLTLREGQYVDVSCMMSSKRSLLSIMQVREEVWNRQKELEREQQLIRDEVK